MSAGMGFDFVLSAMAMVLRAKSNAVKGRRTSRGELGEWDCNGLEMGSAPADTQAAPDEAALLLLECWAPLGPCEAKSRPRPIPAAVPRGEVPRGSNPQGKDRRRCEPARRSRMACTASKGPSAHAPGRVRSPPGGYPERRRAPMAQASPESEVWWGPWRASGGAGAGSASQSPRGRNRHRGRIRGRIRTSTAPTIDWD